MKGKKKVTTKDSWKSGRRKRETISNVARPFSSLNQLTSSTYSSFHSNRMKPTPKELCQTQHSRAHWNSVTLTSRIWPRRSLSLSLTPSFPSLSSVIIWWMTRKGEKIRRYFLSHNHRPSQRRRERAKDQPVQSDRRWLAWIIFIFHLFFFVGKVSVAAGSLLDNHRQCVMCVCEWKQRGVRHHVWWPEVIPADFLRIPF